MKAFAYLTAVVLVVIGLGALLAGGLHPEHVYGPPGEQFTGALPSAPRVTALPGGLTDFEFLPSRLHTGSGLSQALVTSVAVGTPAQFTASLSQLRNAPSLAKLLKGLRFHQVGDYELSGIAWSCSSGLCSGQVAARQGDVLWLAVTLLDFVVISPDRAPIAAVLSTFHPVW